MPFSATVFGQSLVKFSGLECERRTTLATSFSNATAFSMPVSCPTTTSANSANVIARRIDHDVPIFTNRSCSSNSVPRSSPIMTTVRSSYRNSRRFTRSPAYGHIFDTLDPFGTNTTRRGCKVLRYSFASSFSASLG